MPILFANPYRSFCKLHDSELTKLLVLIIEIVNQVFFDIIKIIEMFIMQEIYETSK